ncbi:sensor histidine kinase [Novosphingobium sp. MBES04]|uniref:sensor histidine kinase n=1 Tax=Novosphingobium sp. MBES04 TaxID=1206458 RepID=UPI000572F774|nr:ATP-binding protein [Novosphingobium sp. MBES04]GAM07519.1 sensor protein cpxA [Novosphingobium sp. MBES04]
MIRGRLFWKILLGFLFTYFAVSQAIWLLVTLTLDQGEPPPIVLRNDVAPAVVIAAQNAIRHGGIGEFHSLEKSLPAVTRQHLSLRAATFAANGAWQRPPIPAQSDARDGLATAPDGTAYLVRFTYPDDRPLRILNLPPVVLIAGILAGLLFASMLAWYLTSPITHLRRGFEHLAGGDLSIRLSPRMGSRRDEIADLSSDFDRMARQLEQLVEARDRLLHDVSHELRSPLARIQLALALAGRSPQRSQQALERVEYEVTRLDTLVGELLTLARAENEGSAGEDYFDLAGVTESVVADVRYEAEPDGVTIGFQSPQIHPGSVPLVRGNSEFMRRALENILRNALRFSPKGGRIQVSVTPHPRDRRIGVVVTDDGPGIPEDLMDAMFQPFVRSGSQGAGFGLGLAIASRAVRLHGGTIEARNAPERGLRVEMRIPTAALPATSED